MKKRDGWCHPLGIWYAHPNAWTDDEGDDDSSHGYTRTSERPGKECLTPPLSKTCRMRYHPLTELDQTLAPDDFLRLVDAAARMVAQILERQIFEPTAQQDVADPLWDQRKIVHSQYLKGANNLPLANYNGVPWPTVQINDTTYKFDQWIVNEYSWASGRRYSQELEILFREIPQHTVDDHPASQADG